MKLLVYSRADLSRTVEVAGAPFLATGPANVVAREFRASDMDRPIEAVHGARLSLQQSKSISNMKRALAQGDSAIAELIERFGKVE